MAVLMFLVRGAVGNLHDEPGDDSRDQIDRTMQGLGNQRETADQDADHEFGRGHSGTGHDRNRRDGGFLVVKVSAHERGCSSPSCKIKAPIKFVSYHSIAVTIVANRSD